MLSEHDALPVHGICLRAIALVLILLVTLGSRSRVATAGATDSPWSPLDSLATDAPGTWGGPRVGVDSSGTVTLVAAAFRDSTLRHTTGWRSFRWTGTAFEPGALLATPGALSPPEPVAASSPSARLFWLSHETDPAGRGRVLAADLGMRVGGGIDTVMVALLQSSETAAAIGRHHEWVVRCEQRFPRATTYAVRVVERARSGAAGRPWSAMAELGVDEFACGASPLGGDSLLVVYAGESGLAWAIGHGSRWIRRGVIDARPWRATHPRLRPTASGGAWLLRTDRDWARVARYEAGTWTETDSVRVPRGAGKTYWTAWCDLSRDDGEPPVLAWGERGYGHVGRDVLCVALPGEDGWGDGEEVPGSEGAILPTVARDRDGTVWVAWSLPSRPGVFFTRRDARAGAQ